MNIHLAGIYSYSIVPGSVLVGIVADAATALAIRAIVDAESIHVLYQNVLYSLVKRHHVTTTLSTQVTQASNSQGLLIYCLVFHGDAHLG